MVGPLAEKTTIVWSSVLQQDCFRKPLHLTAFVSWPITREERCGIAAYLGYRPGKNFQAPLISTFLLHTPRFVPYDVCFVCQEFLLF